MGNTHWETNSLGSGLGDLITLLQFEYPDLDLHNSNHIAELMNKEFGLRLSSTDVQRYFNARQLLEEEEAYLIRKNSII